jgi:DNA recombination protein RmuC
MEPVMISFLYASATAVVVGVLLYLALARLLRRQSEPSGELETLRTERNHLVSDLERERIAAAECRAQKGKVEGLLQASASEDAIKIVRIEQLTAELRQAQTRIEAETIAARTAAHTVTEREQALETARHTALESDQTIDRLQRELQDIRAQYADAKAHLEHSERANTELQGFLDQAQTKLSGAFTELAGRVFDEKAQVFEKNVQEAGTRSKADIDLMLKPFADRLAEFRQRVDVLYGDEARERAVLLGAVTELKTLNQDMADKAAALTRALKGNAKIRGDWGELMLESVLNGCGLEVGLHYDRQTSSTDEEGQRTRPDIVVRLPDERRVVVDSKVNLLAWIDAMNADTPELQAEALRRHIVALKQHVRDLGEKNYPKALGPSALEMTVAFVPTEGALSAALGSDLTLQTYAFERGVVFASPNTLMALLRVIERLWTRDKLQRRASEMSELGGKVLDSLTRFLEEFDSVGARLGNAQEAFERARTSLVNSNQAVIPRARRLASLGARGKRALPTELQPDLVDEAEDQELLDGVTNAISHVGSLDGPGNTAKATSPMM